MLSISMMMLTACAGNAAEQKVRADLDALQSNEAAGSRLTSMQELLTKESGEDLKLFLKKVRDFDYEIIGSEEHSGGDERYTIVNVKIISYDFGREYLAAWTDYLRNHGDLPEAPDENGDDREFYSELFSRLSKLEDRKHISYVDIRAIEPMDNDEWVTDISSNEELQDALFGGMIGEMKSLADE